VNPGEKGGGVREVGVEGVESGIPKMAGSGRNRENYATLHRAGTGIKGCGKGEF